MADKRTTIVADLLNDLTTFGRFAMCQLFQGESATALSRTQLGLLFVISRVGAVQPKELAERFHMSTSAASQAIDDLEELGFVAREGDAADRRKVRVVLTKQGAAELEAVKASRLQQVRGAFDVLSDDELAQLLAIEKKLVARLQELHAREAK